MIVDVALREARLTQRPFDRRKPLTAAGEPEARLRLLPDVPARAPGGGEDTRVRATRVPTPIAERRAGAPRTGLLTLDEHESPSIRRAAIAAAFPHATPYRKQPGRA
jgi:hypothetical protein